MSESDTDRYGTRIPGLDDLPAIPPQAPEPEADPAPDTAPEAAHGLTERDLDILDFERQWWKHAGAKERAVRDRFGCSPTRYYQALNALLDRPEALEHDPMLVSRLRRLRTARQRARSTAPFRRTGV
ncbi:MAG: DUF3263 domain-containing protein [Streptomycetaceae bacterium]|nr:DUF3263 domain-containing protein [Streptomycetaceae bacterium]